MLRIDSLLLIVVTTVLATSSLNAKENQTSSSVPQIDASHLEFFEKEVRPLLIKHCYDCHGEGEVDGGLAIDSREGILLGGDSGKAIVPGKPDDSLIIEAIRYKNEDMQMPPDGKISQAEIKVLEKWIRLGAPDPREIKAGSEHKAAMGMSVADGKKFWSFVPISNPDVPEVKDKNWVKTPIDAFVLAKLEENDLQPALRASKTTLIRRVTFDLIGLPPTPKEIKVFVTDKSPEAFEKVVERLLNSPQYGVRWGRHWLDVVRYADSNGMDENLAFGNAWRFRDYVIDSFTQDQPFDRFLIEQLAGDLLPEANRKTITATGFLSLGAKVLAEPDREKLAMDTIDEQLEAVGKAFLGMSFGCVRCHNHKFDPIMQADYYALGAIFKGTKTFGDSNTGAIKHWHEHSFATKEELESLKKINAEIAKKKSAASSFKTKATAKLRGESRKKATEYLLAAVQFDTAASLKQVQDIAEPLGLHARILHHCRLHLEFHRDDPFFAKWHELNAKQDVAGIKHHYEPLFEEAEIAFQAAKKKDAKAKKLDDARLEPVRAALYDLYGFLEVPAKPEFAFDQEMLNEYYRLMEEARILESNAPDETAAMAVADGEVQKELPIHIRGSHRNLGKPVAREFPEVMRTSLVRPVFRSDQSGRLELARWMASTSHPLTSRVYVNRIWRWHFGAGIVKTTDNFGKIGSEPTHPELLDWLARRFMETGWSTKQMHRLILSSNVYQMRSQTSHEQAAVILAKKVDPENNLLWEFRIQRLEAEQLRDAVLAASDRLDTSLGGKTVPLRNRQFVFNHTSVDHTKYDSLRRAVYLPVIRNNLYTLFEQFDFPDPTTPTGNRNATTVAPQALLMLNSPLILDSADALAIALIKQAVPDVEKIKVAYLKTVGREPTEQESKRAIDFIQGISGLAMLDAARVDPVQKQRAWSLFCQALFSSNEFIYVK